MARTTYHVLGGFLIIMLMFILLFTNGTLGSGFFSNVHVLKVNVQNRASQGIATHDGHIFLTTSINEKGTRENIISVYTMDGKFLKEKRNASNTFDPYGRLMDFGDALVVGTRLYVTLYNWHSLAAEKSPLYSQVAMFDTTNLSLLYVFDIGGNTVEGIAHRDGYFWTAYHDKPIIKQFDANFTHIKTFPLDLPDNVRILDGYMQGIVWYGNDIFVNIHGPNVECSFYSPGLLRYHYNDSEFEYVETIVPPTYGSGQGLDVVGNTFYFVDRPWNGMVKSDLEAAESQSTVNSSSKMTLDNGTSEISASTSVTIDVNNETLEGKKVMLSSDVVSFLSSGLNVLEKSDCEQATIKTRIINEISNETQNLEGTEATNSIIGVEVSKALNNVISSSDKPNQKAIVSVNTSYTCKRVALKSIFCDIAVTMK